MGGVVEQKSRHFALKSVGLRAQATAAGLVQLCAELERTGVLDTAAVTRIKGAIADEISLTSPRSMLQTEYRDQVCARLDAIFSGRSKIGSADNLDFIANDAP